MKKFVDTLQKIQIAVGGVLLLIFLATVVYQITCRYLGIVAMWTEDVSMYSFIWAVFMGAGAMVHSAWIAPFCRRYVAAPRKVHSPAFIVNG